jgi:phage terminase large subunit GpA-like protein
MIETSIHARRAWRIRRSALMRRALAPPPKQTVSEWADRHRRLSGENSASPGQWRTDRVPYLREIMDTMSDPDIEEVVFKKSAQVGYTDGVIGNVIGYYIDHEPSPIMIVQPTKSDAEEWSKEKLQPLLEETPRLAGRVSNSARNKDNTILKKRFPGGSLTAVGTNSPRGLRRATIRIVLFDEVDAYEMSAGSEGDPITLGTKRALTFGNRKILKGSTPLTKGTSRIDAEYEASDQRKFYVPCPHCGLFQTIEWRNIRWDKTEPKEDAPSVDLPETTYLVCDPEQTDGERKGCGGIIEERQKVRMVQSGEWRATHPGRRVRGYYIHAFYSLFAGARWETLVREFLDCRGNKEKLQVWTNTVLGESFEEDGERVDVESLLARLDHNFKLRPGTEDEYLVPEGVAFLTGAIDVQGDRLECTVRGWGLGEENWLIDTRILEGDPGLDAVWRHADERLWRDFMHENGSSLRLSSLFVDTGGHHSSQVYKFTRARRNRNFFAIKGSSTAGTPILSRPSRNNEQKAILFSIGTVAAKDAIMSMLKVRTPGPKYVHLPHWLDDEHLEQLTSEKVITRYKMGRPIRTYVKIRDRNEQLDMFVYDLAAFRLLRADDAKIAAELEAIRSRAKPIEAVTAATHGAVQRGGVLPRKGWVGGWK